MAHSNRSTVKVTNQFAALSHDLYKSSASRWIVFVGLEILDVTLSLISRLSGECIVSVLQAACVFGLVLGN